MIVDFIKLKSNIKFFFFNFWWNLSLTIFMAIVTMQIRTVKTLFLGGWWNFSLKKFMAIVTTKTGMVKAFFFFWGGGTLVWQYLWPLLEGWKFYSILFYHLKKLLYQLYHIILQYTQHLIFYFPIQYFKIIYLHNKIYFSLLLKKKKNYIYIYIFLFFSFSLIFLFLFLNHSSPPKTQTHGFKLDRK